MSLKVNGKEILRIIHNDTVCSSLMFGSELIFGPHRILFYQSGNMIGGTPVATAKYYKTCSGLSLASSWIDVSSGGTANSTTVNSGGSMNISSGGMANNTTVNSSGYLDVSSGGTVNSTMVNSGGSMVVSSGGAANSAIVNYGGRMYLSSGGTATSIRENGGYVDVNDGAAVTFIPNTFSGLIYRYNSVTIHSGTIANNTSIASAVMDVYNSGTANSTTVNLGGYLHVSSGGLTNNTNVNNFGVLHVSSGGSANNNIVCGLIHSANSSDERRGYLCVSDGGTAVNTSIRGCGLMSVSSGGMANSTTIEGSRSVGVTSSACLLVDRGTVENNIVNSYGSMYVSGGTANINTVNNGGILRAGCIPDGAGMMSTWKGTAIIQSTTINSGGSVVLFGSANSTIINVGGSMYCCGGEVNSTIIDGGRLDAWGTSSAVWYYSPSSCCVINDMNINSGGLLRIMGVTTANNTIVNSGASMIVNSGGTANSITVSSGGSMVVSSGGTALNVVSRTGAFINVAEDAVFSYA